MRLTNHAFYSAAEASLLAALNDAIPGSVIVLTGPSGVGKTKVRHAAMSKPCQRTTTITSECEAVDQNEVNDETN
ncbi:putative ribosome biogenesis GTPase RsgA [Luteibacter sp. HA06]